MELKIILLLVVFLAAPITAEKKVVCYWFAEIDAGQLNANLCTHIIYSFLGLDSWGGLNHLHRSEAEAEGYIHRLTLLRTLNPNLKILAAVGGYNDALIPVWSAMAANPDARNNFANNILAFIQRNNLNGIDIDWEYPNYDGNSWQDVNNFVLLLQRLKQSLGSSYSLSVAIGAGQWRSDLSYDIPGIFATVDFVNLMSYDLHGGWESITGIHGALFRGPNDDTDSNVDAAVNFLLHKGIHRDQLILGIPAYGNAFNLFDSNNNGVGAPGSGAGSLKYHEICPRVNSGSFNYRWEDAQQVPYAFSGNEWVGFDDIRSVTAKAYYIRDLGLGGAMFWALDTDDYTGACGNGRYPLIQTVHNIVHA